MNDSQMPSHSHLRVIKFLRHSCYFRDGGVTTGYCAHFLHHCRATVDHQLAGLQIASVNWHINIKHSSPNYPLYSQIRLLFSLSFLGEFITFGNFLCYCHTYQLPWPSGWHMYPACTHSFSRSPLSEGPLVFAHFTLHLQLWSRNLWRNMSCSSKMNSDISMLWCL